MYYRFEYGNECKVCLDFCNCSFKDLKLLNTHCFFFAVQKIEKRVFFVARNGFQYFFDAVFPADNAFQVS